jgi:glycosyltransferase involved in cell wall biosynthesis
MKITVGIPCYNGSLYIGSAIMSILKQVRLPDEILVVDDGSTDNSVQVISLYPVKLLQHNTNKGLAAARNTILEAARGDVIVFIDADVVADSNLLSALLKGYEDETIGGVGGQGIEVNVCSLADWWRKKHASQSHGNRPKRVDFLYGLCMSFRTEVLRKIGGFNPMFRTNAEDIDVSLRVRKAGYYLQYLPEAKVYHLRTDDVSTLKRTIFNWYKAAYKAKYINNSDPWRLLVATLYRLIKDPVVDLVVEHNIEMAQLSWRMGWIKICALWQAFRTRTTE